MKRSDIDYGKFLELYGKGETIQNAMIAAGYSQTSARGGRTQLPRRVRRQMDLLDAGKKAQENLGRTVKTPKLDELIDLGRETSDAELSALRRGRVVHDLRSGDNSITAIKAAGEMAPEGEEISEATAKRICELWEYLSPRWNTADQLAAKERELQAWENRLRAREQGLQPKTTPAPAPQNPTGPIADCSTGHHAWDTIENTDGWKVRKCARCEATEIPGENITKTVIVES